ncbi:MAG TPA: vWA domain-containing protein, partial [Bacteroidales bacterium]|nr:vWA domain-containing protein [Bacteroidales bacterium]
MGTLKSSTPLLFFFYLWIFFIGLQPAFCIEPTGFDVKLSNLPTVTGNGDGTSRVCDFFSLYKDGIVLEVDDASTLDLTLYEDNVPVEFNRGSGKKAVDFIICLDVSGSMGFAIEQVKKNTESFVHALEQQDYAVRLGLITFGNGSSPALKLENNGDFYPSTTEFLEKVKELSATGGTEEWFDAVALASQYQFHPSAFRGIVLITDENGDRKNYNYAEAADIVKTNSAVVYSLTLENTTNAVNMALETSGKVYDIKSEFNQILYEIANKVTSSFNFCYSSSADIGEHELKLEIDDNKRSDTVGFKIGATPVIQLDKQHTTFNGRELSVQADIKDADGTIDFAKISLQLSSGTNFSHKMSRSNDSSIYSFSQSFSSGLESKVEFTVQAVDDEGKSSIAGP